LEDGRKCAKRLKSKSQVLCESSSVVGGYWAQRSFGDDNKGEKLY
jgi:hypothetical protein